MMQICDIAGLYNRNRNVAYLRQLGRRVGLSTVTSLLQVMTAIRFPASPDVVSDFENRILDDYHRACRWVGWLPLEDFIDGYRAIEKDFTERRLHFMDGLALHATPQEELPRRCSRV